MADGVMDSFYNKDKDENYEIADAQARSDILEIHDDLDTKVDKVTGKGLSTNDYTTEEKNKLTGIERYAEVNNVWFCKVTSIEVTESPWVDYYLQIINRQERWTGELGRKRFIDGDIFFVWFNGFDAYDLPSLPSLPQVRFFIGETPTQTLEKHPYNVVYTGGLEYKHNSDCLKMWNKYSMRTFIFDEYYDSGTQQHSLVMAWSSASSGVGTGARNKFGEVTLSKELNLASDYVAATASTVKRLKDLIDAMGGGGLTYEVVQALPVPPNISTQTIYLLPKQTAGTSDYYDEYLNPTGTSQGWELIGSTEVDLSNYYTKTETDALLADKADDVDIPYFASGTGLSLYQSQVGGGHTTYSYSIDSTVMAEINDIQNKADTADLANYATTTQLSGKIDKDNGIGNGSLTVVRKAGESWARMKVKTEQDYSSTSFDFIATDGDVRLGATIYNSTSTSSITESVLTLQENNTTGGIDKKIDATEIGVEDDLRTSTVFLTNDGTNLVISDDIKFNGGTNSLSQQLSEKQATLVSGTNIKTVNGNSLLGSGNVNVFGNWTLPQKGGGLNGGGNTTSLRYNTVGGSLTGSGKQLYIHLPFPFPPSLPNLTYCRISIRQAQNGDYAYAKEGTSWNALNASNTQSTLMENGVKRSSVSSITCGELGIHGFNLTIAFNDALAYNSSGAALYNNIPVACFVELKGTWST